MLCYAFDNRRYISKMYILKCKGVAKYAEIYKTLRDLFKPSWKPKGLNFNFIFISHADWPGVPRAGGPLILQIIRDAYLHRYGKWRYGSCLKENGVNTFGQHSG